MIYHWSEEKLFIHAILASRTAFGILIHIEIVYLFVFIVEFIEMMTSIHLKLEIQIFICFSLLFRQFPLFGDIYSIK